MNSARRALSNLHRPLSTTSALQNRRIPIPTFPVSAPKNSLKRTATCPPPTLHPPTCACDPEGLDIDRTTPLANTMPRYFQHVLISTGKTDWSSKIEFDLPATGEGPPGGLAARIKELQQMKGGRGLRDPFAPSLITNSSLPAAGPAPNSASAYLFPANLYFPSIPTNDPAVLESWIRKHLLPPAEHASAATAPPAPEGTPVEHPVVLICSHTSRDSRCGAYYPVLEAEFKRVLKARGLGEVRVAATSHLSGHKFAGNVVVYMPGGWGVWYGRVGVNHVQGIVDETVVGGRVVGDICRGVVGREVEE